MFKYKIQNSYPILGDYLSPEVIGASQRQMING
jgi:hypothetical protein